MSLPVLAQPDLYDLFQATLQDHAPDLTDFSEGSDLDTLAGVFSVAGSELTRIILDQFSKTFFDLANGPEITGGPDDLQTLAVDHFGIGFERPGAIAAVDVATFSRASTAYGDCLIPAGTVIKTAPDANGLAQRYSTNSDVTIVGTSIPVAVTALVAGAAGSASAGTIHVIESSLLDQTITVANAGNATGADAQDDAAYRQTISNLILALAGATVEAVEAKAETVTGIITATAVETVKTVIEYNIATGLTVGTYFNIPKSTLYVADKTGTANDTLIAEVVAAIAAVKSAGVTIDVRGATAVTVNWTGVITLNPSGPNYATFAQNDSQIITTMKNYINSLPVGTSFVRATANAYILSIWGPAGTNDLTGFTTSAPLGDVSATVVQKMVAGTVVTE